MSLNSVTNGADRKCDADPGYPHCMSSRVQTEYDQEDDYACENECDEEEYTPTPVLTRATTYCALSAATLCGIIEFSGSEAVRRIRSRWPIRKTRSGVEVELLGTASD